MIQANELRIGNIFFDEDSTPCYFAGAWQRKDGWISRDSANNTYKESQMYPIPLTPEILDKCGFEKNCHVLNLNDDWFLGWENFIYLQDEKQLLPNGYACERIEFKDCANLHQLQNLYFALTGTELEIKL